MLLRTCFCFSLQQNVFRAVSSVLSYLQAEAAARARVAASYTYTGVQATLQQIWREEGTRGLVRGMESRLLYNAAFSAIGFLSFETARSVLLKAHLERKVRRLRAKEEKEEEEEGQDS